MNSAGSSVVDPATGTTPSRARRGDRSDATRGGLVAGLVLIVIGAFFLLRELVPSIDFGLWWPMIAIGNRRGGSNAG